MRSQIEKIKNPCLLFKASRREIPPSCINKLLQKEHNQGSTMLASWSIVVLLVMFCMTTLVQTIPSCEILIALCVTWKSRAYISALYQNLENSDRTHRKLSYHQTASSRKKKKKKRGICQRRVWWRWWGAAMHYAVKFLIRSLSLYTSRASIFLLLNYFRENILVRIEVQFHFLYVYVVEMKVTVAKLQ